MKSPDQTVPATPASPHEMLDPSRGSGLLTAALVAAAIGSAHQAGPQAEPIPVNNQSPATPGLILPTPQRVPAPNVPYEPRDKENREVAVVATTNPAVRAEKPAYPAFRSNLKGSAVVARHFGLPKQPRPNNMHGSTGSNHHVSRSSGGDRRGRRVS